MTLVKTVDLKGFGKKHQGKVRDFYIGKDKRIIITTDRQSAFDVNLGFIPYKGAVLNLLSNFWFEKTKHIIQNHLVSVPHPNITIAKNCEMIPIEMVVRGYMTGVTKTSIWYSYQQGERTIYGIRFPDNLKKNDKLPRPVITPTSHGGGKDGHDERLTRQEIIQKKIIPVKLYKQMEEATLKLFSFGSKLCKRQGLILVDTKYEFGFYKDKLTLVDEIHTPDSSRFWIADTYKNLIQQGKEPENFDKEFLLLWYAKRGYRGDGPPPKMPKSLIAAVSLRYIRVYERLTEKRFNKRTYQTQTSFIQKQLKNITL